MPEQSFKNHTRFDPRFHFVLIPILLANLVIACYFTVHNWPGQAFLHLWSIVMAVAFLVLALTFRPYSLKNQDRIIRLEERLRLAALLPPAAAAVASIPATRQLVALRFASDAELPALAQRTLAENLAPAQIKQAITTWRPDHQRI